MWAHATPVMLYTLSMISDFTSKQARQQLQHVAQRRWLLLLRFEAVGQLLQAGRCPHAPRAATRCPGRRHRPRAFMLRADPFHIARSGVLQVYQTISVNVLMIVVVIPGELIPGSFPCDQSLISIAGESLNDCGGDPGEVIPGAACLV